MTRKLEELFDLPSSSEQDISVSSPAATETSLPVLTDALATIDKIELALPAVQGLESSDGEMDDIAAKARESFENLMDLGMNVDSRYAAEIFSVASTMLGHAITAKTAKVNKKLRIIDLQLKKARLDQTNPDGDSVPSGEGRVLDRNELLQHLISRAQEKKTDR